jgi:hypothetical protein
MTNSVVFQKADDIYFMSEQNNNEANQESAEISDTGKDINKKDGQV